MDLNNFLDEKFAAENEICKFYTNNMTRSATEYATERWNLKDYFVLLAEDKKETKERNFILIEGEQNQIVYHTQNYEALLYHIDMVGLANQPEDQTQDQ
jgi:hypothetical protein